MRVYLRTYSEARPDRQSNRRSRRISAAQAETPQPAVSVMAAPGAIAASNGVATIRRRPELTALTPNAENLQRTHVMPGAQALLRLQQSHGNAFVRQLIQTQLPTSVQRKPAPPPTRATSSAKPAKPAPPAGSGARPAEPGAKRTGAVEEAAREAHSAPPSAGRDARFQGVVERLEKTARNTKAHEPSAKKVADARAASVPPANDRRSRAQANQVGVMDQQQAQKPKTDDFLSLLRAEIARIAPRNMEETERFKKEGKAAELKGTLTGQVNQRKDDATQDIEGATQAVPDPNSVAPKEVNPIPSEPTDAASPELRSQDVLPVPKSNAQVSVEANKQKAHQLMAANDLDEGQLRKANEPQFNAALDAKKGLEVNADQVPKTYRRNEQAYLQGARTGVLADEKNVKGAMSSSRSGAKGKVQNRQLEAKKREEEERKKVAAKIESLYAQTKKKVEDKLNKLDREANAIFDSGEKAARDRFESYVDRRMSEYKSARYSGLLGPARWAKDKLFGMPDEVNRFYEEGRDRYLNDMDTVLIRIAGTVEARLKEAKTEIANGKKEIHQYVAGLPKDLQKAGQEAEKNISARFDELSQSVEDKKRDLARNLARRYKESRDKLDERIQELQAENKGLVDTFVGKIKSVIEILRNFKNRISSLLKKAGDVIRRIVKDPIGFLRNLVTAVKLGFTQFSRNILKHLQAGLLGWLFGALAGAGIRIPSEFSVKAIFGLVLQILGVTRDRIRAKVVKQIGAKNVERIEQAWRLVSMLISGGPAGLWEEIKAYLGNFKEIVLSEIRNWVITQIVKQAILWLISLFNPASALLKAILAIYNVVTFFIERINQISQLVQAIVESVTKIVAGNIGAAANWIEQAMGRSVPVIIGFLANLLGLTGVTQKIQSIIRKLQQPVDRAIDKVIAKIVSKIKNLFGGRPTQKTAKTKPEDKWGKAVAAVRAELTRMGRQGVIDEDLESVIPQWRKQYGFKSLEVKVEENDYLIDGSMSPSRPVARVPRPGSENNPFKIVWPKPLSENYPILYFGGKTPIDSRTGKPTTKRQSVLKGINTKGQNFPPKTKVEKFHPHDPKNLPDQGPKIGLEAKYRIAVGIKVGPLSIKETGGGEKLLRRLRPYGFNAINESLNADHVHEIQLGGDDITENLWPLNESINKSAGPTLSGASVEYPNGGKMVKIAKLKEEVKRKGTKYWFQITGVKS